MSPCKNDCGSGESGLSWLDGDDTCARCRPEMPREPIPYLHQNRPPLIPLREAAAVGRDNPFRPPVRPVEPLNPVPAGAETSETITEPLRAIKPPPTMVHLDAQTAAEELAEAEQIGAATIQPLLGAALAARIFDVPVALVSGHPVGHPTGQTNPPIARSRWSRVWARLLRIPGRSA